MAEEQTVPQGDPRVYPDTTAAPEPAENWPKDIESEGERAEELDEEILPGAAGMHGSAEFQETEILPETTIQGDGPAGVASAQANLSELRLEQAAGTDLDLQDHDQEALLSGAELQNGNYALSDVISIAQSALASSLGDDLILPTTSEGAETNPQKIRAYAKIEFEDGQFYMDTYQVELGRDIPASKRAAQRQLQREFAERERGRRGDESSDEAPHHRYAQSSAVSESGGIVNYEASDRKRPRRSRKGSASASSSSYNRSRQNSNIQLEPFDYNTRTYQHQEDDEVAKDPSPNECPLIPVHPPVNRRGPTTGYGAISRRHARISYNFERNWFEFETVGRNGGFVDDEYVGPAEVAVLEHGSKMQIGGVVMRFLLPNQSEAGRSTNPLSDVLSTMSFEFEDGRGNSLPVLEDTSPSSDHIVSSKSSSSDEAVSDRESDSDESEQDESEEDVDEETDSVPREHREAAREQRRVDKRAARKQMAKQQTKKKPQIKLKLDRKLKAKHGAKERSSKTKANADTQKQDSIAEMDPEARKALADSLGIEVEQLPPPRKGPGRPPKDGIMSKREYAQLARQQKERAKAEGLQNGSIKPSKPLNGVVSTPIGEKRKYTKRRKPEEEGDDGEDIKMSIEDADGDDGASASKIAKEKRPAKPPRSPSPVFDESTLTEEQLAKPTQSYVVLIHEALSNSPSGQMSLPQIYRAIERRYPFFKLRVTTQGWQSSVRHNLSQHPAFRKIEKDGKGWMWGLVPEVSIEKEKKRRPTPPPASTQAYNPTAHQAYPPEQQYPYTARSTSTPNGQPPTRTSFPYPPAPTYAQPPTTPGISPYGAPPAPLAAPTTYASNTYQSPYAPTSTAASQPPATNGTQESAGSPYQAYSGHYYNTMHRQATVPASQAGAPPAQSASPYPQARSPIKPFTTDIQGVPKPVLDGCSKFKAILAQQLTEPDIEQAIDRALDRALRSIMHIDDPHAGPEDPTEEIFVDQARSMLQSIWKNPPTKSAAGGAPAEPAGASRLDEASSAAAASAAAGEGLPSAGNSATVGDSAAAGTSVAEELAAAAGDDNDQSLTPTAAASALTEPEPEPEQAAVKYEADESTAGAGPSAMAQLAAAGSARLDSADESGDQASASASATAVAAEQAEVVHASKEAVQKVITSLSVGSKRSLDAPETRQRPKRVAV